MLCFVYEISVCPQHHENILFLIKLLLFYFLYLDLTVYVELIFIEWEVGSQDSFFTL